MFLTRSNLGKHFGELAFIRGIVYYKLSAHEQKPLVGCFTHSIPNVITRISATIHTWLPPLIIGIAIYKSVERAHKLGKRKDPKDYMNEVDPNPPPPPPPPKKKCGE